MTMVLKKAKQCIPAVREAERVLRTSLDWCASHQQGTNLPTADVDGVVVVQETRDGELVVLHDLQRVLDASRHAAINDEVIAQLAAEVDDLGRAAVQVSYSDSSILLNRWSIICQSSDHTWTSSQQMRTLQGASTVDQQPDLANVRL